MSKTFVPEMKEVSGMGGNCIIALWFVLPHQLQYYLDDQIGRKKWPTRINKFISWAIYIYIYIYIYFYSM